MKISGNAQAAQEIMTMLSSWDVAVCSLNLHEIMQHCSADVSLFDVTFELTGIMAYQQLWERYQQYFRSDLKVFRDKICIHAEQDLATVHCLSKIDACSGIPSPNIPWCRTTICMRRQAGQWKIFHQHISLPLAAQD